MATQADMLRNLSKQQPGYTQDQSFGLQQQIAKAPGKLDVRQASQQLGTQAQQATSQEQLQIQQREQAKRAQLGKQAVGLEQQASSARVQQAGIGSAQESQAHRIQIAQAIQKSSAESKKRISQNDIMLKNKLSRLGIELDLKLNLATMKQRKDLSKISSGAEWEMLTSRIAFDKDARGRKFVSDRQLSDWVASASRNQQQLAFRMQTMQQVHQKKISVLQETAKRIMTRLDRESKLRGQDADQTQKKKLLEMRIEIKKRIQAEQNKSNASKAKGKMIGTVLGTVAGAAGGFILGGPGGAVAGASAGASVGGAIGTANS